MRMGSSRLPLGISFFFAVTQRVRSAITWALRCRPPKSGLYLGVARARVAIDNHRNVRRQRRAPDEELGDTIMQANHTSFLALHFLHSTGHFLPRL
ncbi:hypothetical protein BD626DRAFT_490378, partial [Schizophyllum amplum]